MHNKALLQVVKRSLSETISVAYRIYGLKHPYIWRVNSTNHYHLAYQF